MKENVVLADENYILNVRVCVCVYVCSSNNKNHITLFDIIQYTKNIYPLLFLLLFLEKLVKPANVLVKHIPYIKSS